MYKKKPLGSLLCFMVTGVFAQFIPCLYSILEYNGLTVVNTINLNNFYGICKCFMFIGYFGVLFTILNILTTDIAVQLRKEKKEIQDSLEEINRKVSELQNN